MRVEEYWKICGYCAEKTYVTPATLHYVKDNMYKDGKSYAYYVCDTCRSWNQFDDELKSMKEHYDGRYYTQKGFREKATFLEKRWAEYSAGDWNLLGWLVSLIMDGKYTTLEAVAKTVPKGDMPILDFGCGNGQLVRMLRSIGYTNVHGYDPYLPKDIKLPKYLHDSFDELLWMEPKFYVMVSCHAIEHMHIPELLVSSALALGVETLILQCPIVDGTPGTAIFGKHWVGLDAPRHIRIPTNLGIEKVIDRTTMEIPQTGLRYKYKLVSTYPNSTLFSMVASMAAEQGIPWTGWKYKLFSLPTRAFIGSVTWIINKFTNKAIEPLDDMRTYICQRLIEPIGASSDLKTSSEVTQQVWH